jgi:pimeloyl-ACP methyl ester carboxylesterase
VDSNRIFALTNSEGGIHALNYQIQATDLPFAGLILTSAPARAVGIVARGQLEAQLKPVPGGEKWLAAYDAAIADFTAGRNVEVGESLPDGLRDIILGVTNPVNQPFARELWATEPVSMLIKVKAPTLIVIGKKDMQVDWRVDGPIFEATAKLHDNITLVYVENANHVLKCELRERSQLTAAEVATSYNAEGSLLDPEAVTAITTWLAAHC